MTRDEAVRYVVAEASNVYAVDPAEVLGLGKSKSVASARKLAMALARKRYGWSLSELGKAFSRDPSTISNAWRWAVATMPARFPGEPEAPVVPTVPVMSEAAE